MTKSLPLALLVLAAAGCRSDGGFDRADTAQGMAFSTSRVADRTAYNVRRTVYLAKSAPRAIADSFSDGAHEIANTYRLYVDPHAVK